MVQPGAPDVSSSTNGSGPSPRAEVPAPNRSLVDRVRTKASRSLRIAKMLVRGAIATDHPMLVTLVVTRRCNLDCGYCNEYDLVSEPVPLLDLERRIDRIARLGTSIVTISGGEPLLHPQLEEVVARIRRRGMIATLITNGYLLSDERIAKLNAAGLDYLQISIDNLTPDDVSKKSLKMLDVKLRALARLATFTVNVNLVVGAGVRNPEDALVVARRARELGFAPTIGVVHDSNGQLKPLGERDLAVYREIRGQSGIGFGIIDRFEENLAQGKPTDWRCRAGARYLYVDEDGLVHWCSQQRGTPGTPLLSYGRADMRREYRTEKPCAAFCTIQCVHRSSIMDNWRGRQEPVATPAR